MNRFNTYFERPHHGPPHKHTFVKRGLPNKTYGTPRVSAPSKFCPATTALCSSAQEALTDQIPTCTKQTLPLVLVCTPSPRERRRREKRTSTQRGHSFEREPQKKTAYMHAKLVLLKRP